MHKKKLAPLDALRGIAILLVIAAHFSGWTLFARVMLGNAGVILFFFLSGFLMDRTLTNNPNLVSYGLRRSFRILPMYWFSLLLVIAFGEAWTPLMLSSNATFTAPIFGQHRMLGVYWTLYIEVLFYCVAPLIKGIGETAIDLSIYALLVLLAFAYEFRIVGSGAPFYLTFCFCGMQIGAWHRGRRSPYVVWLSMVLVGILMSAFMPVSIYLGLIPVGCAGALFVCLDTDFRFRPLEFVGGVSYSWYLLHSIFGYKFQMWTGIALTFAASVVTHYFIERPAITAGKAFIKMTTAPKNAPPASAGRLAAKD